MGKRQRKVKKPIDKDLRRTFEDLQRNKGVLILVVLFLGSTVAYAFLSGGSLGLGDKAAGEPPENRLSAEGIKNPYVVTQDFLDKGRDTFLRLCVACHLEDGGGPPEHSVKEMAAHHTEGDYFWIATYGIAGSAMAGWKDTLTPEQRWQTVMYMRRILGGVSGVGEAHQGQHDEASAPVATGPRTPQPEMAELALNENFDSLVDGLKYTPEGAFWARFVNVKSVAGTSLEEFARSRVEPDAFYGVRIVGMMSADYPDNSWIELHDVGYDEFNFAPRNSIGMTNIVSVRPFIFGHTKNVNLVLNLINNPGERSAFDTFKPLLDEINQSAGIEEIFFIDAPFSEMKYVSLSSIEEGIEMITAYKVTNASALDVSRYEQLKNTSEERGIDSFEIIQTDDVFLTRLISSNLTALMNEAV